MKRILYLLFFVFAHLASSAQSPYCFSSDPFCTGTTHIFPAGVNSGSAEPGADYGCLGSTPNPAWYHMRILEPGSITIEMFSTPLVDIDFILWGPFIDPVSPCVSGLTGNKIVDCSYSTAAIETATIPNGQVGEYYILLITNFSNQPCNITFQKIAGSGETDCTIIPPPISSNSPVCYSNTIELYADSYAGASYYWTGPNGFESTQQNPVITNAQLTHSGDYTLVITVDGETSEPISTEVNVYPLSQPAFDFTEVCFGEATSFTDQSTVQPDGQNITTREWNFGDGNSSSQTNPTHTYANPDVYTVELTTYTANMQCPQTVSHQVEVFSAPYVDAGPNQEIPNGWTTQLNGSIEGGSGQFDVLWEPAHLLEDPTEIMPQTVAMTQTTVFTLTVTDLTSGCFHEDDVTVNVTGGALYVQAEANPMVICQGEAVQLMALTSGGAGSYTYSWTSNPPGFEASVHNPIDHPDVTTTYTISVFDGQNTVSNQVSVTVNPKPIANAGTNQTINTGTATQLNGTASSGSGTYFYLWSPADSLANPGVDFELPEPMTKNLHASTQFVFSVSDDAGCESQQDAMYVHIEGELLSVFAEASQEVICYGHATTLTATAFGGSGEYNFSWEANNSSWQHQGAEVEVSPETTTVYTVTVDDGFKYNTHSIQVLVNSLPHVDLLPEGMSYFATDTIQVCVHDSVMLDAGANMLYQWSNGSSARRQRITTNGNFLDWQTWWVQVTNPVSGCVNYDTITVFFDFTNCNIGLDELTEFANPVRIFPNPSQGIFHVVPDEGVDEMDISIINSYGKTIYRKSGMRREANGEPWQLDLSSRPNGVYLMQITTERGSQWQKLILNQYP